MTQILSVMTTQIEAGDFSALDPLIERLEFKVTVLPNEEPSVEAEIARAGVDPVKREVYFYDTLDLALCKQDLFLRARITEGAKDDSTVKLRPLPAAGIPANWRETEKARFEADVIGSRMVPSAKRDGDPDPGEIERVKAGDLKPSKLFNQAQEALVKDALPDDTELKDLAVLGPVVARVWDLPREIFPLDLSVEEWSLPEGLHFIELSFKVDRGDAESAQRKFHAYLDGLTVGREGDPKPKTTRVLEILADRMR